MVPHCVTLLVHDELHPVHAAGYEQLAEHVRVMQVPGQPDASTAPGAHTPSPVQPPVALHAQLGVHVSIRVPQFPQLTERVALGAHTPSPEQPVHPPQLQSMAQVRDRVPQLPHAPISTAPGVHAPPDEQALKVPQTQVG